MSQADLCPTCGYPFWQSSSGSLCPRCLFSLALETPAEVPLSGEVVSHYRIQEKLGGGGMGVVYRAEDTRLGRKVVLKFLPEEFCLNVEALSRFQREARLASSLNHPHICTVYDVGEYGGRPYIVMELLKGHTLKSVSSQEPLPTDRLRRLATQIGGGLAAAHSLGIIHRDIKPANLFVTNQGEVKILDFGLAKEEVAPLGLEPITEVTSQGELLGTLPYMSPEQVEGETLDHRTDLFSLGTVLYELATGKSPFVRTSSAATMNAILHDRPRPARKLNGELSSGLSHVIEKLQAKDPGRRYQTAGDLLRALKEENSEGAIALSTTLNSKWRRHWWSLPVLALVVAVVVGVFSFNGWRRGSAQIESVAVLPFENVSRDVELEYFAEGMTYALIISLDRTGEWRVPARTSVMRFKGSEKTLSEIARELQVDALVEGTIQPSAEKVAVRFSLFEAKTKEILLSGDYQPDRSDFVEIQNEIASAIAREIRGELTSEMEEEMRKLHPADPEAYELYMRGLYLLNERESLDRAVEYFCRAADQDPGNALVQAHLAHAYLLSVSTGYGERSPVDVVPKAKEAARKALERNVTLPQAEVALAMASFTFDWDWDLAEKHFRKAIETDPEYATAYHWYGLFLAARGDLENSLEKISRARELEPYSPVVSTAMGRIFYYRRDYEQAERYYEEALELERDFLPGLLGLGLTHLVQDQYQEAVANFQKALPPEAQKLIGALYVATQDSTGAEGSHQVDQEVAGEVNSPFYLAVIACVSGATDNAFHWLDRAAEVKSEYLVYIAVDPLFDPLRQDPRYGELLARIGLDAD